MKKRAESGFTLLEMLVVLAITAVLLGIIIVPVIQSFNFTRAAESLSEQQQRGRILVDQIARDIAIGTGVLDNEGVNGETMVEIPNPNTGTNVEIPLYYSRIDIFKPALGGTQAVGGGFVNTHNGRIDPTLQAPNGQVILPAAQGATIVRYFIGLRNPFTFDKLGTTVTGPGFYNNPYDGVLTPFTSANANVGENLYVLYRLEFRPYLVSGTQVVPNTDPSTGLFKPDPNNPNAPYLNDPYFFMLSTNDANGWNGTSAQKAAQIAHMQNILKQATIVTEESRFDMIQPLYDLATRKPLLDSSNNPRILSLIQFRPSPVSQEPAVGPSPTSLGNETTTPGASTFANLGIAPNVLRTTMGGWSGEVIQVIPYNGSNMFISAPQSSDYLTVDTRSNAPILPQSTSTPQQTEQNLLMLNQVVPTGLPANLVLFDLNAYANAAALNTPATPQYPFSAAIAAAENEDGAGNDWLTQTQTIQYTQDSSTTFSYRDEFVPFDYNPHSGQINPTFNISEVGNINNPTKNQDNVPLISTSATVSQPFLESMTPSADASSQTPGTTFYDPDFASINELFNVAYNQFYGQVYMGIQQPNLRPFLQRFVDLRFEPEQDGWASPMDPDPNPTDSTPANSAPLTFFLNGATPDRTKTPWIAGWTGFDNVTIVPGSEEVIGPDQNPGPNFGVGVRYMRVTSNPGPDQYVINYTNQTEPEHYSQLDPTITDPANQHYDPWLGQWVLNTGQAIDSTDPTTMLIQPRYKVGYVQFDSDPNVPLPSLTTPSAVKISYKFQFNRPADAFAVSYDSREVINVLLSLRSYPQTTNMPNAQSVTLQASAPVKNFIR